MNAKTIEKRLLLDFIEIYRDHPCLWKSNSPDYANRDKKNEAYALLLDKLKEWDENARREGVTKKINNLRSAFRREFKKYESTKTSGKGTEEVYTPQLWYFNDMMFVKDQAEPRKPRSTIANANANTSREGSNSREVSFKLLIFILCNK